jgi:hypothetical protein
MLRFSVRKSTFSNVMVPGLIFSLAKHSKLPVFLWLTVEKITQYCSTFFISLSSQRTSWLFIIVVLLRMHKTPKTQFEKSRLYLKVFFYASHEKTAVRTVFFSELKKGALPCNVSMLIQIIYYESRLKKLNSFDDFNWHAPRDESKI